MENKYLDIDKEFKKACELANKKNILKAKKKFKLIRDYFENKKTSGKGITSEELIKLNTSKNFLKKHNRVSLILKKIGCLNTSNEETYEVENVDSDFGGYGIGDEGHLYKNPSYKKPVLEREEGGEDLDFY